MLVKLEVMGIVVSLSNFCQPDEGNSESESLTQPFLKRAKMHLKSITKSVLINIIFESEILGTE